ncbi:MAG: hypothetical protein BECKG1743D_GA0114223_111822 [Candidatus Kentron sp. G]|nr:MAG: hypothetical protein BECKG1743F_GA0114225_112251 [Candidatus Kentron sp. G]VFN07462.1 MAG: hypothetical protein BECKG1743E_GA0114224_112171 [Candidatus Kentron sp. G]VFN07895.1 MAG: hypothetical protein BECKG1743D_GA0114223_111822 [Candidatus Kentron sp. G]
MNTCIKQLIAIELDEPWTPKQALAVYECLTGIAEALWRRYEDDILDPHPDIQLAQHHYQHPYCEENRAEDFDDNFPF